MAGPECRRALARGWLIVVRSLVAGLLALILLCLLWVWWITAQFDPWHAPLVAIRVTLWTAAMVVLTIVVVQAPAVLAGSLAGERERGVLQLLLTTAVTPREIVSGRLLGKLSQVGMIVMAGLPILAMLCAWNGLSIGGAGTLFLLFGAVGVGGGGLAVAASVVSRRGRDALLSVYILMLLLLLSPLLYQLGLPREAAEWLMWLNPFYALNTLINDRVTGPALAASAFWTCMGIAGVALASVRLRPSCLGAGETQKKSRRPLLVPAVTENPMLWKELFIERAGTLGRFGRWLGVAITVAIGGGSLVLAAIVAAEFFFPRPDGYPINASALLSMIFTGARATFMGWLLQWAIGLRAAVSIASERERGTWDALLMSPLEAREIVRAKLAGSLYALRWMVAAMLLALTLSVVVGAMPVWEYVTWVAENATAALLMAAIGVRASLSLPTATKAMTWTIALWLGSFIGVAVCAFAIISVVWLLSFAAWLYAVSYAYVSPTSSPWVLGLDFETGWAISTNLVVLIITALIVADTALRFDQIAGRMAGGTVAVTVDKFLYARNNRPVFLPTKGWSDTAKADPPADVLSTSIAAVE
jgi:ABC-type transport system involved in multi-copper enzyme maturation permease subunit